MADLVTPPNAGEDCRELWKVVAQQAKLINSLGGLKISVSQTTNKLTLTEGGATLELMLGDGGGGGGNTYTVLVPVNGLLYYGNFVISGTLTPVPIVPG